MLKHSEPIVTVDWLYENLDNPNLLILDGTISKVTEKESNSKESICIKNALIFDIKNEFSDVKAPFPNTMISEKEFEQRVQSLGINNDSCIVVYDHYGYYSCARVWWMFKSMGFENIAVLDGGLPEWNNRKYPTQFEYKLSQLIGNFKAHYKEGMIHSHVPVLDAINDSRTTIVDARASNRFLGLVAEPRKGLRSGHIPYSKNMPFATILDGTRMKSKEELKDIFSEVENEHMIFSCGSGITACILALGAEIAGVENKSVYDGSWTEWGSLKKLPIEK